MSENYNYFMYKSPEEESWSTDPNDQELMFTHDYLAATNTRSLLEEYVIHKDSNIEEDILLKDNDDENDVDVDMDYEEILEVGKNAHLALSSII